MVRSELVTKLAHQYPNILRKDIERIIDIIFFEITSALAKGRNIEIRGFGTYKIVNRKARTGRNPKNSKPSLTVKILSFTIFVILIASSKFVVSKARIILFTDF